MEKIFTTYKAQVESRPLGEQQIGLSRPGRYNGFNNMNPFPGMTVEIFHLNIPFTTIQKNSHIGEGDAETYHPFGAIFAKSGCIIHRDEPLYLTPDLNGGDQGIRRDLVVCEHVWNDIVGGTPPLYLIIKGAPDGSIPQLTNVYKQVAIGYLEIPAGAMNSQGITWHPAPVSLPGDMMPEELWDLIYQAPPDATTTEAGLVQFANTQEIQERVATDKVVSPGSLQTMIAGKKLTQAQQEESPTAVEKRGLTLLANTEQVLAGDTDVESVNDTEAITPKMLRKYGGIRNVTYHTTGSIIIPREWNGQVIVLSGNSAITPVVTLQIPNSLPRNFRASFVSKTQTVKFVVIGNNPTPSLLIPTGKLAESKEKNVVVTLGSMDNDNPIFYLEGELKAAIPNVSSGLVPMNCAIPYFPINNQLAEFDNTGKGISGEVIGWAICNGNNGTRDLRGRFVIHINPAIGAYDTVGDTGGEASVTLTKGQLPKEPIKLFSSQELNIAANRLQTNPNRVPSARGFGEGAADHDYTMAGDAAAAASINYVGNSGPMGNDESHNNMPPYYASIYIQRVM